MIAECGVGDRRARKAPYAARLSVVFAASFALVATGCNVAVPRGSHGTEALDAAMHPDGADGGACARAVVVAESDYMSTNVALLGLDGSVLSTSVASSATGAVGLAAPLSNDVVVPTMPVGGSELVLVDRAQTASNIVWVDPKTAAKRALSVRTGFWSNPYDYAAISNDKAYVPRYGTNPMPGSMPFDAGGDVLIVDPSAPSIVGSIDMKAALGDDRARAQPNADSIVVAADRAYVLLGALPGNLSSAAQAPSRLVAIDTTRDVIADTLVLDGLFNCTGLALSPDGQSVAVMCSGKQINSAAPSDLDGSGVAVVDVTGSPRVAKQFDASDVGPGPIGFYAAFASKTSLVVETFGYDDPASGESQDDTVAQLDLTSGQKNVVLRSAGEPFTLNGIVCDTACGVCFVADAKRMGGVVHRFAVSAAGTLSGDELIKVETDPGLPPQYLGLFR